MCIVSAIHDYGNNIPDWKWTQPGIDHFRRIIEMGEEFDKEAGQPDCVDPEKELLQKRLKALEKRLKALEKKAKKKAKKEAEAPA